MSIKTTTIISLIIDYGFRLKGVVTAHSKLKTIFIIGAIHLVK